MTNPVIQLVARAEIEVTREEPEPSSSTKEEE